MVATFKVGKQNYVFSNSWPPILGGLLGVWGKWIKRAKFIYNIQNFNPEQVLAANFSKNKLITDAMMFFDKFSCRQSNLIITVGRFIENESTGEVVTMGERSRQNLTKKLTREVSVKKYIQSIEDL